MRSNFNFFNCIHLTNGSSFMYHFKSLLYYAINKKTENIDTYINLIIYEKVKNYYNKNIATFLEVSGFYFFESDE